VPFGRSIDVVGRQVADPVARGSPGRPDVTPLLRASQAPDRAASSDEEVIGVAALPDRLDGQTHDFAVELFGGFRVARHQFVPDEPTLLVGQLLPPIIVLS